MRRLFRIIPLVLALSVPSCSDGDGSIFDPPFVDYESWVLRGVNGMPLPAVVRDDNIMRVVAISDTLILREDGTGKRVSVEDRYLPGSTTNPARIVHPQEFTWDMFAGQLEIHFPCPLNASCIAGPHMMASFNGMVMTLTVDLGRATPAEYLNLALL